MTTEGWLCPTCGSVYAPWVAKCSTCPMGLKSASTVTWRYPPDPECDHRWLTYGIGPTLCGKCGAVLPGGLNP